MPLWWRADSVRPIQQAFRIGKSATDDSGVPNTLSASGCTRRGLIAQPAAASANHVGFVSSVAILTSEWKAAGLISSAQKGKVQSAAAKK